MAKKKKTVPLPTGPRYSVYVRRAVEKQKSDIVDLKKLTISANALSATDQLIDHFVDVLTQNAGVCCKYANNRTLQSRHVQAATKMTMSGRLSDKSVRAGVRAVTRYVSFDGTEAPAAESQ